MIIEISNLILTFSKENAIKTKAPHHDLINDDDDNYDWSFTAFFVHTVC